jgi:hypothetical protein
MFVQMNNLTTTESDLQYSRYLAKDVLHEGKTFFFSYIYYSKKAKLHL